MKTRYRLILARAALAHWLWRLSKRIMPPGHSRGAFDAPAAGMQVDLASYAARIGIVEPLLRQVTAEVAGLEPTMARLRAEKRYADSDELRRVITASADAAGYAFGKGPDEWPRKQIEGKQNG